MKGELFVYLVVLLACGVQSFQHFKPASVVFRRSTRCMSDTAEESTPSSPFPKSFTVFIGNLPRSVTDEQLVSEVSHKIPTFEACAVSKDKVTGESRGFAYVRFPTLIDAETAQKALTGVMIDGALVKVSLAQGTRPGLPIATHSIYIGNVDPSVTENDILSMCHDILGPGAAVRVRRNVDKVTNLPVNYVHVDLRSQEDMQRALHEFQGISILGREIRVREAKHNAFNSGGIQNPFSADYRRASSFGARVGEGTAPAAAAVKEPEIRTMFIGNVDFSVDEGHLKQLIDEQVGPGLVVKAKVHRDPVTGRPKGFAHVDFEDEATVERVIERLNGLELGGRMIRCDKAKY